jgi:isochorismate pyruvate lyase
MTFYACSGKKALQCENMTELRGEIDRLDRELMALFATRQTYIDRAITLKPRENLPARIESRVEDVADKVRACADKYGLNADVFENMWRVLMEDTITHEANVLGETAHEALSCQAKLKRGIDRQIARIQSDMQARL